MPSPSELIYIPYDVAREHILDADIVLYRGKRLLSRAIRIGSRSEYSHSGMAGWSNSGPYRRLFYYEMLRSGGQGTHLRAHAEKQPGMLDVYHVQDLHVEYEWNVKQKQVLGTVKTLNRQQAVAIMQSFCRPGEYGFMHLLMNVVTHLPFIRWFTQPSSDDALEDRTRPPTCSEADVYALKVAFTDAVKNTQDMYTQPGDLARSPLLHYKFTLIEPTVSMEEMACHCDTPTS